MSDHRMGVAAGVLVCALAAAACGNKESVDGIVDKNRDMAEAKLSQLEAVAEKARALPPLTEGDQGIEVGDRPMPHFGDDESSEWNGGTINLAYLDDITERKDLVVGASTVQAAWFGVANLVRKGQWKTANGRPAKKSVVKQVFSKIERSRYVMIIRADASIAPELMPGETGNAAPKTFASGAFLGEAHLFDLQEAVHLGGYRLEAQSSSKVRTSERHAANSVEVDLVRHVIRSILEGWHEYLPDAFPPWYPARDRWLHNDTLGG